MKKLETITNFAVIVVAVLMSVVMTKQFLWAHTETISSQPVAEAKTVADTFVGKTIKLDGVKWDATRPTLVMALATHCHFCTASAPFYQRLAGLERSGGIKVRSVAIFSDPIDEAARYEVKQSLAPDQTVSMSFDTLGVAGTPTLLLVSSDGTVLKEWVGKLSKTDEDRVVKSLQS